MEHIHRSSAETFCVAALQPLQSPNHSRPLARLTPHLLARMQFVSSESACRPTRKRRDSTKRSTCVLLEATRICYYTKVVLAMCHTVACRTSLCCMLDTRQAVFIFYSGMSNCQVHSGPGHHRAFPHGQNMFDMRVSFPH
jgi:hypothetical protein